MGAFEDWDLDGIEREVLEQMCAGITLVDLKGRIKYYNREAARLLDRKPEYIGREVTTCHQRHESIEKIKGMIASFVEGRQEPFHWEIERFGRRLLISFSPLRVKESLVGFIHMAVVKPT